MQMVFPMARRWKIKQIRCWQIVMVMGLSDSEEIALGTDALLADSDQDELLDGEETELGTNPLLADSDDDGLTDGRERSLKKLIR